MPGGHSARSSPSQLAGAAPVPPKRKWRAITLATLVLVPAYWFILGGAVSAASDDAAGPGPQAGPLIAFGVCLIPFVFLVLAFLSEHPRPPGAVLRAMGLAIVVGIPVSALAFDAITGIVAGVGAGGIAALRADPDTNRRWRVLAVVAVSVYVFVLARTVGVAAVLLAPCLPFTAIGLADHLAQRRAEREAAAVAAR
jgi:hypothetical protein